jgi:hypothetical protein
MVFSDMTPCSLVGGKVPEEPSASVFIYLEVASSEFTRNVGNHATNYTTPQHTRQSNSSPSQKSLVRMKYI